MERIQKTSHYLLAVFNILLIALPLWNLTQWIFIETKTIDIPDALNFFGMLEQTVKTPEGIVNLSQIERTSSLKIMGVMTGFFGVLPFFLGVLVLKSLFKNYQRGEIFSLQNAKHYRQLGWLFFLDALLVQPLSGMLLVLLATLSNAPGHRYISIHFGTPNLEALFCGLLVIVISWVMIEGYRLSENDKFTI
ncbi:DUF2975 domain-containing protein [Candidatus Bealeia paramacronuclearis]|uniref:DUF2975 domain-containing protein n=1 Tax=Candidatus Bealeia paramacronuclearis TaxID=1921001 RepID=A0ABZ2C519_9PROT|nr:hypothetical protein [Candidatus Bealeia paramacronuclearis]